MLKYYENVTKVVDTQGNYCYNDKRVTLNICVTF